MYLKTNLNYCDEKNELISYFHIEVAGAKRVVQDRSATFWNANMLCFVAVVE